MLTCIILLAITAVIAIILVLLFEWVMEGILGLGIPARIYQLIRVLVGLYLLLGFLQCIGFMGGPVLFPRGMWLGPRWPNCGN